MTVSQGELPSYHIPTAMLDSNSMNTVLLEVMISSKYERVFIRDLGDLTLQIIFDASWASMNIRSKHPIARDNSRLAPCWPFYLHCGREKTGSGSIIYHLSSSSLPSITTWDRLNWETLAGKSAHREVTVLSRVGNNRIDQFNGPWIRFSHTEEAKRLRNYNSQFAKEIHIWHLEFIYITWIDRLNAPHWQRRTFELRNFTKTPVVRTSC